MDVDGNPSKKHFLQHCNHRFRYIDCIPDKQSLYAASLTEDGLP